jgi:hypothetical protein
MSAERRREILEVLNCEIGVRPSEAPGIPQLLPHVLSVSRQNGELLVDFAATASRALETFVAAERLCCAGIDWRIEREPGPRLRIIASEAQLAELETLWLLKI